MDSILPQGRESERGSEREADVRPGAASDLENGVGPLFTAIQCPSLSLFLSLTHLCSLSLAPTLMPSHHTCSLFFFFTQSHTYTHTHTHTHTQTHTHTHTHTRKHTPAHTHTHTHTHT